MFPADHFPRAVTRDTSSTRRRLNRRPLGVLQDFCNQFASRKGIKYAPSNLQLTYSSLFVSLVDQLWWFAAIYQRWNSLITHLKEKGGSSNSTVADTIHLNNCGNSANAEQVSERSQTINVEGAAQIGVSIELAKASVAGKYVTSNSISKKQTVTASPNTNMEFVLLWTEQVEEGSITVDGYSGQATYRVNVPISVEQISVKNLGCSTATTSTDQPNGGNATQAPTVYIPPTPVPTAYVPPTSIPTEVPIQDTPDGTILEPGMAWYKNGKSILLNNYRLTSFAVANSEAVNAEWIVKNVSTHSISVKFTEDNFKANSNIGQGVTYKRFYDLPFGGGSTISIAPADSLKFSIDLWIAYSDPSVNMVTISVSFSDIQNARWNIPIYH